MNALLHKQCLLCLEESSARKILPGSRDIFLSFQFMTQAGARCHDKSIQNWFYFGQHKEMRSEDTTHLGRRQVGSGGRAQFPGSLIYIHQPQVSLEVWPR